MWVDAFMLIAAYTCHRLGVAAPAHIALLCFFVFASSSARVSARLPLLKSSLPFHREMRVLLDYPKALVD